MTTGRRAWQLLGSAVAIWCLQAGIAAAMPSRRQSGGPQIDFSSQPANDHKAIALTFDDGPDNDGISTGIVDILNSRGIPATFFVNTNNYNDVATDGAAQNVIRYISSHGMTLGDHTVHHYDLTTLSDAQVAAEITGVETTLQQVLGNPSLRLTLFRAPYGSPYLGGSAAQIARIGAIVSQHAVEIGWAIDPQDYNCAQNDPGCVQNNVFGAVDSGSWGIVLLHATQPQTLAALPGLIDGLQQRGFHFITVEDVVQARYGESSAQLVGATPPPPPPPPPSGGSVTTVLNSNKCLDVRDISQANGAFVQLWDCSGGNNQQWHYDGSHLVVYGNKCLDLTDGNQANGNHLQIWDCVSGNSNQEWLLQGNVLRWAHGNKCMDLTDGSTANGNTIQVWDCLTGNRNQQWTFS